MKQLNEQMKLETVTASSDGGKVIVSMNGIGHVQSVKIDDAELSGSSLEHAIAEATNAAGAAAKQLYAESASQMVKDMDLQLPGLDSVISTLTGSGS
jgi:hypothetical protein